MPPFIPVVYLPGYVDLSHMNIWDKSKRFLGSVPSGKEPKERGQNLEDDWANHLPITLERTDHICYCATLAMQHRHSASCCAPWWLTGHLPKPVPSKAKQCCPLWKASVLYLNSSFNVNMSSGYDKTTAFAVSMLISLAAAAATTHSSFFCFFWAACSTRFSPSHLFIHKGGRLWDSLKF